MSEKIDAKMNLDENSNVDKKDTIVKIETGGDARELTTEVMSPTPWEWSNTRSLEEVDRWKKLKIEKEKPEVPLENRKTCWYFEQHFSSFGKKPACRFGLSCRNIHRLADVLPGLKELYKKWKFGGTLNPRQEMDSSAHSAKKIKLHQSKPIQEPLSLSSMITKLRSQPLDMEYANFLAKKSPVIKIMENWGWTRVDGLGPRDRQGIRNPIKSSHPWIDPVTGLMDENRRKLLPRYAGFGYPMKNPIFRSTSITSTTLIENPWKKPDAKDDCCLM